YIERAEHYTNTAGTTRKGVYSCGSAYGPETIDDSISQGSAAAVRALADMAG
ncbi:MAG: pyridine nucleotide-disulfide oxidoreductase, partial [Gammaproteobacteria bacterium]|nr:pyridine nucleotide-disulfide oxidoreductase [Gammaproteobacteria bacterium]